MAVRTTAAKVKEIIETTQTDAIVDAFILGANRIVEDNLGDADLADETLDEIERWLAAHLLACTIERQAIKMGGGPAPAIEFTNQHGQGLELTTYGQMALALDTSGALASLGMKSASITALTSFED
jgi:hypothetical protein